jgi:uncharacterized protein YbaP (TraB family)
MHELDGVPGGEQVVKISPKTQERLSKCAILGTEIYHYGHKIPPDSVHSVDEVLTRYAYKRGIANIGIDHESCRNDYLLLLPSIVSSRPSAKDIETSNKRTQTLVSAYLKGDIDSIRDWNSQGFFHSCKEGQAWLSRRNQAMADNIDALLKGCKKVERSMSSGPLVCFFAIGAGHLVSTPSVPSVVELLSEKGWSVNQIQ